MWYRFGQFLTLGVSRLSVRSLERLAWFLTILLFDLVRMRRKLVLANMRKALGHLSSQEQVKIARQSVFHCLLTALEFLHERHGRLGDRTSIVGKEHLDSALKKGQGAYVLCIHMSSWEAMGGAMSRNFAPSHVVVKRVGPPGLNRFVIEQRERNQFHSILRKKKGDAKQQIQNILSRNEIVGFVMDQGRPGEPFLPFFGVDARTNTSLAAIWRKYSAPIVPAYISRIKPFEYRLHILPELSLEMTEDVQKNVLELTLQFNKVVETMILAQPEQYFWFHNRWRA
ncbi:MAG: lysophospholipid acyltransferase family protein [Deltaproteobacteria bacterium]|nr:lysophospholipid acyltransferase family protein [Deltaproteobacteria bacterium]